MKRAGFTLIEGMLVVALVCIAICLLFGLFHDDCELPSLQQSGYRKVSKSATRLTCLGGHEYYLIKSMERMALAPKFNEEGFPSKCNVEDQ